MTTLTATNAKAGFLDVLRRSHDLGETYTITHNGKPYAALMSIDEYEGMRETIAILKNKAFARDLLSAAKDADAGRTLSFEAVAGRKQR